MGCDHQVLKITDRIIYREDGQLGMRINQETELERNHQDTKNAKKQLCVLVVNFASY